MEQSLIMHAQTEQCISGKAEAEHLHEAAGVQLLGGIAEGVQPHHFGSPVAQRLQRLRHKLLACSLLQSVCLNGDGQKMTIH